MPVDKLDRTGTGSLAAVDIAPETMELAARSLAAATLRAKLGPESLRELLEMVGHPAFPPPPKRSRASRSAAKKVPSRNVTPRCRSALHLLIGSNVGLSGRGRKYCKACRNAKRRAAAKANPVCRAGHRMVGDNLVRYRDGRNRCRTCIQAKQAERDAQKELAA